VFVGCVAGFLVAQRDCSNGRKWDESQQQQEQLQVQQQGSGSDRNTSNSELSSEQQKEVLQGLATLLATALQTKQRQQNAEEPLSVPDASGSSVGGGGTGAAAPDAAGLRQRRNHRS
jgi:hypothetical protein